jgi:serine/threonine protein kinase
MDETARTDLHDPAHVDELASAMPQHIGRYRVERLLGEGGFGRVYLAHDDQLDRPVAVKVPHRRLVSRPEDAEAYLAEARTVAALDHPHIVPVFDVGGTADHPCFFVSKYIEGRTLAGKIKDDRPTPVEAAELVATVAEALHHAHRKGLVHRDIKPGNILLDTNGEPHLTDFGLARLVETESNVTRTTDVLGTPSYMAPEQASGNNAEITCATDIYALGVLLYQLVTGRSPYRLLSYSQLQLERAICMDDPPRPSQMVIAKLGKETDADRSRISDRRGLSPQRLRTRLSGDLDAIIAMAMRKEPDRRYPSVEALADDLNRHLLGQPVRARHGDWRYNTAKFLHDATFPYSVTAKPAAAPAQTAAPMPKSANFTCPSGVTRIFSGRRSP